jgi:branched-subunit amino acid transport protein
MIIWLTIAGMAIATLATRALPLLVLRDELPGWLGRWLSFVPVAVFTALAMQPLLIAADPAPRLSIGLPLVAGLAGAVAAWRGGNVVVTIAVGMAVYWALRLLLG